MDRWISSKRKLWLHNFWMDWSPLDQVVDMNLEQEVFSRLPVTQIENAIELILWSEVDELGRLKDVKKEENR